MSKNDENEEKSKSVIDKKTDEKDGPSAAEVEQAKLELENCRDFSSMNLYKCIDINNLNYISIPSLLKFFLKFIIKLPKKYTDAFYRRTNVKLNMMMTF